MAGMGYINKRPYSDIDINNYDDIIQTYSPLFINVFYQTLHNNDNNNNTIAIDEKKQLTVTVIMKLHNTRYKSIEVSSNSLFFCLPLNCFALFLFYQNFLSQPRTQSNGFYFESIFGPSPSILLFLSIWYV